MHEEWTDKLSDYLDDELSPGERRAVDVHLAACPECARTLDELSEVAERAHALPARPPASDLWDGIAAGIADRGSQMAEPGTVATFHRREPRRISFTIPQLAAASVLLAVVSGGFAAKLMAPSPLPAAQPAGQTIAQAPAPPVMAETDEPQVELVSLADAQYDAAVADLERALQKGRGRLDTSTIEIVEQNLRIIDQAIDQARQALDADPANSYLSGHLVETRRKKLDLLRRAAALTSESN